MGPDTNGARLFAAATDGSGFDRVVIRCLTAYSDGFLVAQFRTQSCVKLNNVVIEEITVAICS